MRNRFNPPSPKKRRALSEGSLPYEETLSQEILEPQRVIETRAAAKKALV